MELLRQAHPFQQPSSFSGKDGLNHKTVLINQIVPYQLRRNFDTAN